MIMIILNMQEQFRISLSAVINLSSTCTLMALTHRLHLLVVVCCLTTVATFILLGWNGTLTILEMYWQQGIQQFQGLPSTIQDEEIVLKLPGQLSPEKSRARITLVDRHLSTSPLPANVTRLSSNLDIASTSKPLVGSLVHSPQLNQNSSQIVARKRRSGLNDISLLSTVPLLKLPAITLGTSQSTVLHQQHSTNYLQRTLVRSQRRDFEPLYTFYSLSEKVDWFGLPINISSSSKDAIFGGTVLTVTSELWENQEVKIRTRDGKVSADYSYRWDW